MQSKQCEFDVLSDRPMAPAQPTITEVSGNTLTLSWGPPTDEGGSRVSSYVLEYYKVGFVDSEMVRVSKVNEVPIQTALILQRHLLYNFEF